MNTAPTRRAAVAASAALLLSSCGSLPGQLDFLKGHSEFLDQSPHAIAKAAFADMRDVTSMRVLGSVDSKLGRTDVDLSVDETSCAGRYGFEDWAVEVRMNRDGAWLRGDEGYWRAQAGSPQQASELWKERRGSWIAQDAKSSFTKQCDYDLLMRDFELDPESDADTVDPDEVVQVGDADAVPITGTVDKERWTFWIAVDAPHHVLKMAPVKDKGMPDELYFEEFGVKVNAPTPDKKDIIVLPGS